MPSHYDDLSEQRALSPTGGSLGQVRRIMDIGGVRYIADPTGALHALRADSASGGALGQMSNRDIEKIQSAIRRHNQLYQQFKQGRKRKRLTPAQIHNLGVLYGRPLSEEEIRYFEDRIQGDFQRRMDTVEVPDTLSTNRPQRPALEGYAEIP